MFQEYLFHFNEENGLLLAKTEKYKVNNLEQTEKNFINELNEFKPIYIKSDYNDSYNPSWGYAQIHSKSKYFLQGFLLTLTGIGDNKKFREGAKPLWCTNRRIKKNRSGFIFNRNFRYVRRL